jgi:integrase
MRSSRLTDLQCKKAGVGVHGDGGGLALQIQPGAHGVRRTWIFRYMIAGRARTMGLGSYPEITLQRAREKAQESRKLKGEGIDPIEHKHAARASLRRTATKKRAPTFDECASACIAGRSQAWRSARSGGDWAWSLKTYVSPVFGHIPVDMVDMDMVCQVLEPLWRTKCETASRVRGRIERVLAYATVRGFRGGPNPAIWRNNLDQILPSRRRVAPVKHFASMPYSDVPGFMTLLRASEVASAHALRFLILTAARREEVLGARWSEMDVPGRVWTIPANRIKAGKEHRVPLGQDAVDVLERMRRTSEHVFTSGSRARMSGATLNAFLYRIRCPFTVHGFRSSFRDWCAERTNYPREICEQALAHSTGSAVELSYRRTDYFVQRTKLMQAWGDFCESPPTGAEVIPLRA